VKGNDLEHAVHIVTVYLQGISVDVLPMLDSVHQIERHSRYGASICGTYSPIVGDPPRLPADALWAVGITSCHTKPSHTIHNTPDI